jgi:hypothetical protein
MTENSQGTERVDDRDLQDEEFESAPRAGDRSGRGLPPADVTEDARTNAVKQFCLRYYETAKRVLFKPKAFFESMPRSGGLQEPTIFLAVSAGINAVFTGMGSFNIGLVLLIFAVTVIGAFLSAVIANAMASAWGGKGDFESTFRVMAYSEAALALGWLPVIGMFAMVYVCVLNFFGLRNVHKLEGWKTGLIVVLSGIIAMFAFALGACGIIARSLLHF